MKAHLFEPLGIRELTFRNRLMVSPMCQYSSIDGFASDWHLVHLGSRAVGGAGVVFTEASAVEARGRISPQDLGIWKDEHVSKLSSITSFIKAQGAVPGIQLAHAGRKASTAQPWKGGHTISEKDGGWTPLAPSAIPFDQDYPMPTEMSVENIKTVMNAFVAATKRSLSAGFEVLEIHAAHGYLIHEFLSPMANKRTDAYGGSFENRTRLLLEVVRSVRRVWPERLPLFVRLSVTDWLEPGGWDEDQSVALAKVLKNEAVDLIDCSSAALVPHVKIPIGPGYQTHFAERIRRETGILTGAVGQITSAAQAETILKTGQADLIVIAREFLRQPYFALQAAKELGVEPATPVQYGRAF